MTSGIHVESFVVACGLWSSQAQWLQHAGLVALGHVGFKSMSPALQGKFLTTGPPRMSIIFIFKTDILYI